MKKICMLLCAVLMGTATFAATSNGEAEQATVSITVSCSIDTSLPVFGSYSYIMYTNASGVRTQIFIDSSGTHRFDAIEGTSVLIRAQYFANVPIMLSVTGMQANNDGIWYDETLISEHLTFPANGQYVSLSLSRW